MTTNPNEYMVGGSHYLTKFQVWDFLAKNEIRFLEGNAIKYVARSRKKHTTPDEDLEKALHYVNKIKALVIEKQYGLHILGILVTAQVNRLAKDNDLNVLESRIIHAIVGWRTVEDLDRVVDLINILRQQP